MNHGNSRDLYRDSMEIATFKKLLVKYLNTLKNKYFWPASR